MSIQKAYDLWLKSNVIRTNIFKELESIGLDISNEIKRKIVSDIREELVKKSRLSVGSKSMTDIRNEIKAIYLNLPDGRPNKDIQIACRAKLVKEVFKNNKKWDCGFEQACELVSNEYKNTQENEK